jgi:hypothetical protein
MSETVLPAKPAENGQQERDAWVAEVRQLADQAEAWAKRQDWGVRRDSKTITEEPLGSYEVPQLLIQSLKGRVVLDPVTRYVGGGHGLVDFLAWPSFDYVPIVKTDEGWRFKSPEPNGPDAPWTEETFLDVALRLMLKG